MVVVAIDPAVAAWAGGPFRNGQTIFRPIVIGPAQVPIVDGNAAEEARVELILLSGLTHRDEPEVLSIGEALWNAIGGHDTDYGHRYWDLFLHTVGEATRRTLMMRFQNYTPQSEWGKKHYYEGMAKGELQEAANALRVLLEARGLDPSPQQRARIESCTEPQQLREWLRRAATATAVDCVFAD